LIPLGQTVAVNFDSAPITAQFIKITFANRGAAIDEVEVRTTSIPEPATLALMGLGLAGIGYRRRKTA